MCVIIDNDSWLSLYSSLQDKPTDVDGPFRFNNRRLLVSYNSYIEPKSIEILFNKLTCKNPFGRVFIGYSYIDGIVMTHAAIDFGFRYRIFTKDCRNYFDCKDSSGYNIHPTIKAIVTYKQLISVASLLLGLQKDKLFL